MSQPFDAAADLKDAPATGGRVRPRDAATVIVLRRDGPSPRVLMGRRAAGHAFMPSKWVFPGGAVDRTDARAPAASELPPGTLAMLMREVPRSRARALGVAAVRELFEETGLRLAPAAGALRPDLSALAYVARAITPPGRPRRYDTRFFLAAAERLATLAPAEHGGELDEIGWFALDDARALDLPAITRFVLDEVEARLNDPERPAVFVRVVRGRHRIDALERFPGAAGE
jgi:8-oxo-dGTP pyrophosphatase MutT (NUDIX family)